MLDLNDVKKIKELVKLMKDNDLTELDLEGENGRISLKRHTSDREIQYVATPAPALHAAPAPAPAAAGAEAPAAAKPDDGLLDVPSPMVGTFYAAPSPDAAPFVKVGDAVTPESVICIVEAMKVFNEIKAEVTGTVAEVCVGSGEAVEFGQALLRVRPGK